MSKKLYSNKMINQGGRQGEVKSPDDKLHLQITDPGKGGTNPEELFAAGYASCFNGAMEIALAEAGIEAKHIVSAEVTLLTDGPADFHIAVDIKCHIEGLNDAQQNQIMEATDQICPYSKATRGNVEVDLGVDNSLTF